MALQTPRRLPSVRPSLAKQHFNTASSPNLGLSASAEIARKASLNALTGGATTPNRMAGSDGRDIEVGDVVEVPGGMHGTVKFVGSVHGKKGVFAGVELAREYAARGKNDGDVDGRQYFTTSVPGAGIFLPLQRAIKRSSPTASSTSFPPTPTTPSYQSFSMSTTEAPRYSPQTPSVPKFSQSVGPGARAPSPVFKPKTPGRPSLARPESPFRKQPNLNPTTPGRNPSVGPASFSKSQIGVPPRFTSPAPGKVGITKARTPGPSRPYSRNNSRLGQHATIEEDSDSTPVGKARVSGDSISSFNPRGRPTSGSNDEEVQRLQKKLEERDRQLKEQAASLAEMEASLQELHNLIPTDGDMRASRGGAYDDADAAQLRLLLREKNEKISMLTAEFDAHRADFRSTIDTLEMASTETERVYQKREEDLMAEIRELQEQSEDVGSVARQLKQLEELVQELEEGLEDARRGEAEARGEVEFLRGEVERGRSELKRERDKAQAALEAANGSLGPAGSREVEQRDDEIRGLKAIIHSLSSGPEMGSPGTPMRNGVSSVDPEEHASLKSRVDLLEREKEELQGLIERKSFREEELEREVERLRKEVVSTGSAANVQRESVISNALSERTAVPDKRSSARDSKGTVVSWRGSPSALRGAQATTPSRSRSHTLDPMIESDAGSSAEGSALWCEICETGGHDILNCTAMGSRNNSISIDGPVLHDDVTTGAETLKHKLNNLSLSPSEDAAARPAPLTPSKKMSSSNLSVSPSGAPPTAPPTAPLPNPYDSGLVAGKGVGAADPDKWCALCERDGHDATACPFEDAF